MRKEENHFLLMVTIALLLAYCCHSCKTNNTTQEPKEEYTLLKIRSDIQSMRATETKWEHNDEIGVYAVKSGEGLSNSSLLPGASNLRYITTNGDGIFAPSKGAEIQLKPNQRIDIISYYPHQPISADHKLRVNVGEQNDLANIDLLYSDNAKGLSATSATADLSFSHVMSQLQISAMSEDDTDLSALKVTVEGMTTEGVFDLATGTFSSIGTTTGNVSMHLSKSVTKGAILHAIVIPGQQIKGLTYHFEVGDKSYTYEETESKELKAGERERRTFKISANEIELINVNIEIVDKEQPGEDPSQPSEYTNKAFYQEQVLIRNGYMEDTYTQQHDAPDGWFGGGSTKGGKRRNYTIYYSTENYQPYMVAYPLYRNCVGDSGRTGAWEYDPEIPKKYQMNLSKSYRTGYSRGHMLASNQRTATRQLNETTFYFTNMVPQNQNQNSGIWNVLENVENNWAKSAAPSDTMYVVCGPIIAADNGTVTDIEGNKHCPIPTHTWKVILKKKGGEWVSIGAKMPNIDHSKNTKWYKYACTVAELEEELGVTFFPQLSEAEAAEVKHQKNISDW